MSLKTDIQFRASCWGCPTSFTCPWGRVHCSASCSMPMISLSSRGRSSPVSSRSASFCRSICPNCVLLRIRRKPWLMDWEHYIDQMSENTTTTTTTTTLLLLLPTFVRNLNHHCHLPSLLHIGVANDGTKGQGAPPRARILSKFAYFAGLTACCYVHLH